MTETISDVACTVCGCVCDDLDVTVRDGIVAAISPECRLAESWLVGKDKAGLPAARVHGQPAAIEAAVVEAANILAASRSPLIYGLSRSSTPGQRAAARLADAIGAFIDTTASTCHAPSVMALQVVGESTCTLGEIRNRANLVVYWGSDPLTSHPRHMERYVDAAGMFVPKGRNGRHVVVVDTELTETAEVADTFVRVDPGADFELIWALRTVLSGHECSASSVAGVPTVEVIALAEKLKSCRYGAVFFGLGLTQHGTATHANVEGLLRLVTELNAHTRFVARRMRVPGDVAGADTVLCWQTGFPFSINLARGYPRYNPGEYTANTLLERREVDAIVLVGSEGIAKLSDDAQDYLREIPNIVLDYPSVEYSLPVAVRFTTAIYGIHRRGTAYRMDEVPIPLRKFIESSLPADHEVLSQIARSINGK